MALPDCNEKDDWKKGFYSTLQAGINILGLKVAHLNCCGLFGKLTEITLILQVKKLKLIFSESQKHLSDKIKDEENRWIQCSKAGSFKSARQGLPNILSIILRYYTKTKVRSKISGSYLD